MSNKTRKWRSAIAMLLVICMLFSIFPVAAFAQDESQTINYVSLGASNVNGYGMHGYLSEDVYEYPLLKETANIYGYKQDTPGSYPVLIKEYLEGQGHTVNLAQLAISSMRAEEVRFLLDDSYTGDAYTDWRFCDVEGYDRPSQNWFYLAGKLEWEEQGNIGDPTQEQAVEALKAAYKKAIEEADLITVDIGINNFGVYASNQIVSNMYENDMNTIDPELAAIYAEGKAYVMNVLEENAGEYLAILPTESLEHMADTMAYALVGFCLSFDAVMEQIYTLNPDATVAVASIQNLMYGLNASIEGIELALPFGDIFGSLINAANVYTATLSPYCDKYVYADVRQNGHVEFFSDEILAYNGDPSTLSQDMKDCFDVYDNDLYIKSRVQQLLAKQLYGAGLLDIRAAVALGADIANNLEHFAIAYQKELLTIPDLGITFNEFFEAGAAGQLPDVAAPYYNGYVVALNTAYDVMAEIMQAGIAIDTLDADSFGQNFGTTEDALLGVIFGTLEDAVEASIDNPNYSFDLDDEYPEGFYETIAVLAGADEGFVNTVAAMGIRTGIGNSFFGHPNGNGQVELKDAIVTALENNISGKDVATEELIKALNAAQDIIAEYYDEAYAYAYQYAAAAGYIGTAVSGIDGVIDALEDINLDGAGLTDELKADVEAEIKAIIATLEAAQDLINNAQELNGTTLEKLYALLTEAGDALEQLVVVLEQAGVDVNNLVIIPALNAAYDKLTNEVLPEIDAALQEAIAVGTDWLMDKAQEAIDAVIEALPEMAQFAHDYIYDYLYNNPEEVIAFFNEYGDEIIDAVSEYGPYALAAVAYITDTYGDEILAFVMENDEEILEVTAMLLKEHGPHAVQLIQVYAEELGYCQAVRELIADLEDQIADLKAQLEDELKAQLEDLKAELEDLYAQLENASDDVKEQIQNAIEEVEKLIDEVEQKIAEIEAAIAELEAQLEAAQKALEEAIEAVEAVVEAIKDAIEAGVETVEEILAAIDAIVDFAEETIAGVQTAIEGIVNAAEDVAAFVEELIANGIVAAEMIEEIIDTVMDIIDGVKAGLEQGDIDAAIEAIRNELTNGYEELSAMLAAIDTAIAEELDAIVADLEAALEQAQDEFEEALYNATHGEIACDAKIFATGGNTATADGSYADILVADDRWNLTEAATSDEADMILYQADPQIFSKALKDGLVNAFATVIENELNPSMADFVLGQLGLEKTAAPNWNTYITDENVMAYFEQAKADLVDELAAEYGDDVAELMTPVIDTVLYAVVGYAVDNIAKVENISAANEDALIVAVGMYNPVQGMTVTIGGEEIDIEALCQYLIEVTDVYNLLYAIVAQDVVFIDASEAETDVVGNVDVDKIIALDGDEFDNVLNVLAALDSNYATADGHAYIANQILDAIEVVHNGGCPECEVKDIPVTGVTLNTIEATMTTGSSLQLVANVLPENATNKAVTWESDDEDLITVDANGLVTSHSTTGSAYIIVTTVDGEYTAECEVTVEERPIDYVAVTGVTLDEEAITLTASGETKTLTATVEPSDATDKSVIWTSSNPEVATVVNGVVTAVANGEAIITVTTANGGYTDTCSVTVNIPTGTVTVPVTGVALDKDTLSLKVGNTAALTATVAPDNATNKAVTWASSNESVATVANGVVTAVAKGTATITVTTVDGSFTDTCAVTVTTSGGGSFGGGGGGGYIKPAKPEVIVPDNAVADGVTVTVDHIDYLTVNEVKDLVAKDDNLEVIGGRDSGALVAVKPANAVTSFAHPVQLTVPVSKSALQNVDDVNKLTLALVTTDAQGNIQLTYVGGNYDASKGTFTAYVNQPGKYVLMEKLDIVKLELTIDRYVVFVNGEPIINDVPSRIVNNRTIVPAARVLHHMGCTVEWLSDTRTVAVTLPNGDVLNLPVDEPIPGFGAAPVIENGRTLVPIAYIADMMDAHVQWVGNDRKVIIVK